MLAHSTRTIRCGLGALSIAGLIGAACSKPPAQQSTPAAPAPTTAQPATRSGPVEVVIPEAQRARAGIELSQPARAHVAGRIRLPGGVAPDAYGQIALQALVPGRVIAVLVEVGAAVTADQPLVTITSTDIADAEAAYFSHVAAVDADHQRVTRLERLVTIGAESRQALDDARAMHASHVSELERAKARLKYLGFRDTQLDTIAAGGTVPPEYRAQAPVAGVVTKRDVNPGQTVAVDAPLLQITRLDRVWVIVTAFEQDASRLRVGSPVTVVVRGQPELTFKSRVAYVDPQVDVTTRSLQARIELPNPKGALKFGMLVDADVELPGTMESVTVPADAVQSMGDKRVVYVQDEGRADVLIERIVEVGLTQGGRSEVRRGLAPTDHVVTRGAAFVRAERLRTQPLGAGGTEGSVQGPGKRRVEVNGTGFQPARLEVPANVATTLVFFRTTDDTCAKEVVVPELGIKKPLPLKQDTEIIIPAGPPREISFACGMNMLKGAIVVALK